MTLSEYSHNPGLTHFINYGVLWNKYHTYLGINQSSTVLYKLCIIKQVLLMLLLFVLFIKRVSPHINVKWQNCNNLIITIHLFYSLLYTSRSHVRLLL